MLLVDAGNTRLKWGLVQSGELVNTAAATFDGGPIESLLTCAWQALASPGRVVAVSVRGDEFAKALSQWVRTRWGVAVEYVVSTDQACGVVNGYDKPARLGADRWVAMIGARHCVGGPVCVVDCGTAVTVDVLDGAGRHLGGCIAPGLELMRRSLQLHTHGVVLDDGNGAGFWLAHDTAAGVRSGTLTALEAFVGAVLARARALLGSELTLVLTGGDAEAMSRVFTQQCRHEPHLVLQGLWVMTR